MTTNQSDQEAPRRRYIRATSHQASPRKLMGNRGEMTGEIGGNSGIIGEHAEEEETLAWSVFPLLKRASRKRLRKF
jgi:hypothetical protein